MNHAELMPFKKFVQSHAKELYCDETIKINGTFREVGSKRIIKNDIFEAHKIGRQTIAGMYKIYLRWFNYTKYAHEKERIFVSVKLAEIAETTGGNKDE